MLNAAMMGPEDFVAWIGGKPLSTSHYTSLPALQKDVSDKFCAVVMQDSADSAGAPVVVVETRMVRNFFAFVSTYITEYTPFTAFFRVITSEYIDLLVPPRGDLFERQSSLTVERLVGVAIMEAALYLRARGSPEARSLSLAAAGATFSAVAIQGIHANSAVDVSAIGLGWQSLRSLIGAEQLPIDVGRLSRLWGLLGAAIHGQAPKRGSSRDLMIVSALRDAMREGRITDGVLDNLLRTIPEMDVQLSKFRGPREGRARAVQEALIRLSDLSTPTDDSQVRDCVAGCLLSVLGDGSFRFLPTALATTPLLPMAPLWFSAWSGIQTSSDLMTVFNCMGRRIVRDLRSRGGVFCAPVDDVALEEVRYSGVDLDSIPRGQSNSISVEIYPNVSSRQGLLRQGSATVGAKRHFQREIKELRELISRSSEILSRLDEDQPMAEAPKSARSATRTSRARRRVE